ncbi:MAG TPA: protein-methionine-sulfoxide reductase heme-binding subunit MsrQ [Bryobacteraceae bacterium]|nr:protein-methionine-sulfoxide reductase heme-binding subunit MsrQ [Bryobacteraceae bacterium]
MKKVLSNRWTKVVLFVLCLVPLAWLGWRAYQQELTANPIEFITHYTGDWTIRFLLITLTVTPLRKLLNQPQLARFRRMLGLFAFFYGCLHLMTWLGLDKFFDLSEMWKDVVKRRFITAGMTAFLLMLPLAITSTAGWVRRLGFVKWQRLHRLIYFSGLAGVVHYYWLVKSDIREPLMYFAIWSVLMIYRLGVWMRSRRRVQLPRHVTTPSTASLRD